MSRTLVTKVNIEYYTSSLVSTGMSGVVQCNCPPYNGGNASNGPGGEGIR